MEQIIKYKNRKFYSRTLNATLTLSQIRDLIKEGKSVQITEYTTGADITAETLTQVLAISGNVPVCTLRALIQNA